MIYYTADLHFGSESVAEKRSTFFSNSEEMDETLIYNWNHTVTPEDTVYLIGDISDHELPFPDYYLSLLKGHKHLIRGNHDTGLEPQSRLLHYFESVTDFLEIEDEGTHITLCHYPIVYKQRGYMIHGHFHKVEGDLFETLRGLTKVMNAGVDLNHYAPVTLKELVHNNALYYHMENRGDYTGHCDRSDIPYKWKGVFLPLP